MGGVEWASGCNCNLHHRPGGYGVPWGFIATYSSRIIWETMTLAQKKSWTSWGQPMAHGNCPEKLFASCFRASFDQFFFFVFYKSYPSSDPCRRIVASKSQNGRDALKRTMIWLLNWLMIGIGHRFESWLFIVRNLLSIFFLFVFSFVSVICYYQYQSLGMSHLATNVALYECI